MDNLTELWSAILKELENSLAQVVIETWISPLEPVSFDGQEFVLKTVNSFKKEIITNKFLDNIKSAIEKTLSFSVDVVIKTEEESININNDIITVNMFFIALIFNCFDKDKKSM